MMSGPPLHSRARRLDEAKLASAKAEFDKMEKEGIIRCSNSPWASPLHCIPKPDGTFRPCGDYRRLNAASRDDRYPLPFIADFTSKLKGAKIDLRKAYHQISMHPDHVGKTALITPFGLFEFLQMPFGLRNSAQAFQRLMDSILERFHTYLRTLTMYW